MAGRKAQRAFQGQPAQSPPVSPAIEEELEARNASIWRAIEAGLFTLTELGTTVPYPYFVQALRYLDVTQRIKASEYERIRKEARTMIVKSYWPLIGLDVDKGSFASADTALGRAKSAMEALAALRCPWAWTWPMRPSRLSTRPDRSTTPQRPRRSRRRLYRSSPTRRRSAT